MVSCERLKNRPQKLTKSSPSIWHYVLSVKSTVKISSIFVAFLENTNFMNLQVEICLKSRFHYIEILVFPFTKNRLGWFKICVFRVIRPQPNYGWRCVSHIPPKIILRVTFLSWYTCLKIFSFAVGSTQLGSKFLLSRLWIFTYKYCKAFF